MWPAISRLQKAAHLLAVYQKLAGTKGVDMIVRLKKVAIALVPTVIVCVVGNVPGKIYPLWLVYYIVASVFQSLAIQDGAPQYKRVFQHSLWLTLGLVVINIVFTLIKNDMWYNATFANWKAYLMFVPWIYIFGYVIIMITGLLTVFWLTRGNAKKQLNEEVT